MTGSIDLYRSALWNAGFAVDRAPPDTGSKIAFSVLGAACSLAFETGAKYRGLSFKKDLSTTDRVISISETKFIEGGSSSIDGLAVVIPALIRNSKDMSTLQQAVNLIGNEASVIVVDDGSPHPLKRLTQWLSYCSPCRNYWSRGCS